MVVITYKQIKLGRESIESVERSTKASFLPILMLGHLRHTSTDKILNIQLTNCGKGLAIKPKVIDIYAGFGIYSFAIADFVKEIHAFEGDEEMTKLILKPKVYLKQIPLILIFHL